MGDSLAAAYGIEQSQGWVALLQQQLRKNSFHHEIVNASIAGETTDGGLRRLPPLLSKHKPTLVMIELGANDGLRAQSLEQMQKNLQTMVELSQAAGAKVIIFEMRIPPNYGPRYTQSFVQRFSVVAERTGASLLPFFLREIALDEDNFQEDGIHPNAAVQDRLMQLVWAQIKPLLAARMAAEPAQLSSMTR